MEDHEATIEDFERLFKDFVRQVTQVEIEYLPKINETQLNEWFKEAKIYETTPIQPKDVYSIFKRLNLGSLIFSIFEKLLGLLSLKFNLNYDDVRRQMLIITRKPDRGTVTDLELSAALNNTFEQFTIEKKLFGKPPPKITVAEVDKWFKLAKVYTNTPLTKVDVCEAWAKFKVNRMGFNDFEKFLMVLCKKFDKDITLCPKVKEWEATKQDFWNSFVKFREAVDDYVKYKKPKLSRSEVNELFRRAGVYKSGVIVGNDMETAFTKHNKNGFVDTKRFKIMIKDMVGRDKKRLTLVQKKLFDFYTFNSQWIFEDLSYKPPPPPKPKCLKWMRDKTGCYPKKPSKIPTVKSEFDKICTICDKDLKLK